MAGNSVGIQQSEHPGHPHCNFGFLYGPRVDRLAAVFKRHGYSVGSGSERSILPQDLYREESFAPVAEALTALGPAKQALASAKAAGMICLAIPNEMTSELAGLDRADGVLESLADVITWLDHAGS